MSASINNFIAALNAPDLLFNSLKEIAISRTEDGTVEVKRSMDFAEAHIEYQSKHYLLLLPLSAIALRKTRQSSVKMRTLRSKLLLDFKVLEGEMLYPNAAGEMISADIVLQEIPNGNRLDNCIDKLDAAKLFAAINTMQSEFNRLKLTHQLLQADTVYIDDEYTLYPTYLHYATIGESGNKQDFDLLRNYASTHFGVNAQDFASYDSDKSNQLGALHGYKYVGNPFEGLCVVEDHSGLFGYIDIDGEVVVEPQYIWAGDIREGRAEVESHEGMGLIDASGKYIIEPHFQIVEFNPDLGVSCVKQDDKWWVYDYDGRKIREIKNYSLIENNK